MKVQFFKTVYAIQVPDYMGRTRAMTELNADVDCKHLLFTLCKNYIKITSVKENNLIIVVPLVNVAFFKPYMDVITESRDK